jgi:hypothetical protein
MDSKVYEEKIELRWKWAVLVVLKSVPQHSRNSYVVLRK